MGSSNYTRTSYLMALFTERYTRLRRSFLPNPIEETADEFQWKENRTTENGQKFPCRGLFKNLTDRYTVRIKVFIRNTWNWMEVALRKADTDYIAKYCSFRKVCVPIGRLGSFLTNGVRK